MWPRTASLLLGLWLMAAPAVLGYAGAARTSDLVTGPLAAAAATIAMSGVTRGLRWVNVGLGAWLALSAWVLERPPEVRAGTALAGVLMVGFGLVRGGERERYGGGWATLWRRD